MNSRVIFYKINSWTCSHCEQYNGFNKDGDYNKEISEMHKDQSDTLNELNSNSLNQVVYRSTNCLCQRCNYYQQLKIEKLSKFEPKKEETYDLEIKYYKNYLEKIYTLCTNCQSKVKFEITKQDGIIKQYLLNLSRCMKKITGINYDQTSDQIKKSVSFNADSLVYGLRIFFVFIILILGTYCLVYNGLESDKNLNLLIQSDVHFVSYENKFVLWKVSARYTQYLHQYIHASRDFLHEIYQQLDGTAMKEVIFRHLNKHVPISIILIYVLSCFIIIISPRSDIHITNIGFQITCAIMLIDFLLLMSNLKICFEYMFVSDMVQENVIALKQTNFYIPLIQLASLILLTDLMIVNRSKNQKPVKSEMHSNQILNEDFVKNAPYSNKFQNSPFTEYRNKSKCDGVNNSQVKFNYSFLTQTCYPLMRFLNFGQSNISNSLFDDMDNHTGSDLYARSECVKKTPIIQPAKLALTNYEPIMSWKNSEESISETLNKTFSSEDSEEGSIVSGLTNLYLGRNKSSRSKVPLSTSNCIIDRSKPVTIKKNRSFAALDKNETFSQYSFYGDHKPVLIFNSNQLDDFQKTNMSPMIDRSDTFQTDMNMRNNRQILKFFE